MIPNRGVVTSQGGPHRFLPGDRVTWNGRSGVVIGLTVEPSDIIEFDDGERFTVGQSLVQPAGPAPRVETGRGPDELRAHAALGPLVPPSSDPETGEQP